MESRSTRVQGLVFGGLMAAMTVVFSLVPGLSVLMPIPLVLAYVRYGGRIAVMTATAATLFTMAFTGVVSAILAIPAGILPGLVFGMGFRRKWKPLTIGSRPFSPSSWGSLWSTRSPTWSCSTGATPSSPCWRPPPCRTRWR